MADPFCGHVEGRTGFASYRLFLALYGLAFALVVYLAKGGPQSGDAPYLVPSGIVVGALTGLFILLFAVKRV